MGALCLPNLDVSANRRNLIRPGAALLCALTLTVSCSRQNGPPPSASRAEAIPVNVATVEVLPLDRTIPVVGTLHPKDEATLGAEVEGRVEQTFVEFGDRITQGQLLAQIDTTTYDALARQAAANLARAQATATSADQTLKRVQKLSQDRIASPSDLDEAVAQAAQAHAAVKAAEAAEAVARVNLEHSYVKAPFDAAIAERIASAGDFLRVGSPLFRVVNDGVLKFIFQVPERHAAQVKKDLPVAFTVDAFPGERFEGRVYLISPQVNLTTRSFNVGALVPNPDRRLKASTFARGELIVERAVPTPVVPIEAVVSLAGVTKVFVVASNVARSREVQLGRLRDGRQEVLAGLKAGETVVISGQSKLYDGAAIRLLEAGPAGRSR